MICINRRRLICCHCQVSGRPAELAQAAAEHFREHFAVETRATLAADAVLEIEVSCDAASPDAQQIRLASIDIEE